MEIKNIIFFLLAAFTLFTGLLSVTEKKIFRAAIYLLFSMMGIAGIYFWLDYQFIAAVQIIVYVGGIVVLIIFSIFLTHHVGSDMDEPDNRRLLFVGLATTFAFTWIWLIIRRNQFFPGMEQNTSELTVNQIGKGLLNYGDGGYALPFEVVSILLLAAMVGCIVIALKPAVISTAKKEP
jgi:NADH-quinone oxidoreductase subunit J